MSVKITSWKNIFGTWDAADRSFNGTIFDDFSDIIFALKPSEGQYHSPKGEYN